MDIHQKRKLVSKQYAPSFQRRVEQMSEAQVSAIYERMLSAGKFKEK